MPPGAWIWYQQGVTGKTVPDGAPRSCLAPFWRSPHLWLHICPSSFPIYIKI